MSSPKTKLEKIQLIGKGLVNFPADRINESVQELILNNNQISSFQGMTSLPSLLELSLDNNNISTFQYATFQPSLKNLSLLNNPILNWKYFKIMCVLAFGDSLLLNGSKFNSNELGKKTNILKLSKEEKAFLHLLDQNSFEILHQYITDGWIIMSLNPVRLLQPDTRERYVYYITKTSQSSTDNELHDFSK